MKRLVARLNYTDNKSEMNRNAFELKLPYVMDDLIEVMEFWADCKAETLTVTLVNENMEYCKMIIVSNLSFEELIKKYA
jgi:hypothetical protein